MADTETPAEKPRAIDFHLVVNWKEVLKRSWSVKFTIASVALTGIEHTLPVIDHLVEIPRGIFLTLSALVGIGGIAARVLDQGLSNKTENSK